MYVVDRDFGFAPNPFHGSCTLATCAPRVRAKAKLGDWVVGMGGGRLKATGRCVYAMRVTETLSFDEYWANEAYFDKRPVRNGSSVMMVGDNIYSRNEVGGPWQQLDSHHSNPDGSANPVNVNKDTSANRVLISRDFLYFGKAAPFVTPRVLERLEYKNRRGHRVFEDSKCAVFVDWLFENYRNGRNRLTGDPFDFDQSAKRYSGIGSTLH
ncbi:MAG: hypothetical protein J0G35_10715 [Acidobacteriales bacterium]|nr:hypothetical protein [Terriglobales bacterium]